MSNLGMSDDEKLAIYSAVAAILHLGNITFEENAEDARGGCQMSKSSSQALRNASALIGVDPEELHHALLSRVMQPSKGGIKGTVIMVPLKVCSLTVFMIMVISTSVPCGSRSLKPVTPGMLWPKPFTAASSTILSIGSTKVFRSRRPCIMLVC